MQDAVVPTGGTPIEHLLFQELGGEAGEGRLVADGAIDPDGHGKGDGQVREQDEQGDIEHRHTPLSAAASDLSTGSYPDGGLPFAAVIFSSAGSMASRRISSRSASPLHTARNRSITGR